ncbi:calcium-binding protein [Microvirga lotononidis]|uniref:Putative calcium-binding protein n=1 Tax=Microvirga lotononidis TaxID=864069 RepID=I4YX33_9HYPH|nr:calcium-binding protein [Microvirga lotononidis]EIM28525.1 putative calcium-binding protein [Microvirga lotononidis]WQO27404.1 calcium-binding protein [Microvirga lotononidis]
MAIFKAFNAAGVGFDMSSTNSSGWAFIGAHPSVTTDLVYDNGTVAEFEVDGSPLVDYFTARYWSDGYTVIIDDLYYENNGADILTIQDLDLYTTVDALQGYAWYVNLNAGHDTFYGNDYDDLIRAGAGNDVVYAYDGDDIVYGDAGADDLYGSWGDDDLYGGTGRDILNGGAGSDYLNGGADNDELTGGSGKDYFVFDTRPSRTNVDRIVDFRPVDDTIMLDNQVFTRVGRDGWLSGGAFTTGSGARDSSDRIIYNKQTGALLYDPDGIGGAAAIKFAQLNKGLTLTKADFFLL